MINRGFQICIKIEIPFYIIYVSTGDYLMTHVISGQIIIICLVIILGVLILNAIKKNKD